MKQKILFGDEAILSFNKLVKSINPKRILIVTGKKSFRQSGASNMFYKTINCYEKYIYDSFANDPSIEDVKIGLKIIKSFKPDLIIAIGGGSAIDMAKHLKIFSVNNNNLEDKIINKRSLKNSNVPFIAIPTTSGTGSESTSFGVIYIKDKKYSVESQYLLPDYALIIPELGHKMSKTVRISTALDAYCQAIESYWSVNSTRSSKLYSGKAIKILKKYILKSLNGDKKAQSEMFRAANYSGRAINIAKTTAAHAISYMLSRKYNLPHGYSVAITLGKFFVINEATNNTAIQDKRGSKYIRRNMKNLYKLMGLDSAKSCEKYWYALMSKLNLTVNTKNIGIKTDADIKFLVDNINIHRLKNNPIKLNPKIISKIFHDLSDAS